VNSITHSGPTLLQDLKPLLTSGRYLQALNHLRAVLIQTREDLAPDEWRQFCSDTFSGKAFQTHPLAALLKESALGNHTSLLNHPLISDVIYDLAGVPSFLSPTANELRSWERTLGFCVSLRARHAFFVRELNDLGNSVHAPRVLAVGAGHLREAAQSLTLDNMRQSEIVAFDRDRACIDFIEREYDHPGLQTASGSWLDFVNNHARGDFDFIYIPTLFDTLIDARAKSLLESLLPLLKPSGRLLAANFAPELSDAAYLEACLDWWPVYRREQDLATLVSPKWDERLRGQAMSREESGGSVFLDLQLR
jgi:hypothetical protein